MYRSNKIVIGAAQFGMHYGIANKLGRVTSDEVEKILNYAYKKGINGIDTAAAYGNSEKIIGNYLKKYDDQKWLITTKVSGSIDKLYNQFCKSIDSLSLKPNAILAHSATEYLEPAFWNELKKIKDKFEIENLGVSLYTKETINSLLVNNIPRIIQCPLNLIDTKLFRSGFLDKLKEKNIKVHIRSVFLQGMFYLSDKVIENKFKDALPVIKELRSIAKKEELTLAELSLLWVMSLDQVDKVIIGVDNIDQLIAHINTLNKNINPAVFEKALSINYENEEILNPSLWETQS